MYSVGYKLKIKFQMSNEITMDLYDNKKSKMIRCWEMSEKGSLFDDHFSSSQWHTKGVGFEKWELTWRKKYGHPNMKVINYLLKNKIKLFTLYVHNDLHEVQVQSYGFIDMPWSF